MQQTVDPPTTLFGRLRYAGPGIIISGSIVGSGELIVTTRLGAEAGFVLLWLILCSCVLKVFLQIELGRYVIASGKTAIEALDTVPGPRVGRVNWLNALWATMAVGSILQLAGVLTSLVRVFDLEALRIESVPGFVWPILFAGVTAVLLRSGRYGAVERSTTALVCLFSAVTVVAVISLQTGDDAIRGAEIATGLTPMLRDTGLVTAFAVLGITGVGAAELIYYPYWCLEKGYAKFVGPQDGSDAWRQRALGWIGVMKLDAWLSCVVYTTGTVAFYLLGAAVLHRRGTVPGDDNLHEVLSTMYTSSLGDGPGTWLYVIGAAAVLFSTFFVATASNSRVVVDALNVFGLHRLKDAEHRARTVGIGCVLLALFCWAMTFVGRPVVLVLIGGVAQAALLPFLGVAFLYLRYRKTPRELAPPSLMDVILWIAVLVMVAIGGYQLYDKL